jgi:hypothetical protein
MESISKKRKFPDDSDGEDNDSIDVSMNKSPGKLGKKKAKVSEQCLGEDYEPSPQDVICARGKEAHNHVSRVVEE